MDKSKDDDVFDFSSLKKLFSGKSIVSPNTAKWALMFALILIPVILTVHIRLMPQELPQTDSWAQSSVYSFYQNTIRQTINSQYPNLPQANKDQIVNQEFEKFKSANADRLATDVATASQIFKQGFRYEENGRNYTFLGDLDSYFYLRQARNLEKSGMICDEVREPFCWDTYLLAPLGSAVTPSMHPYGIVALYRVLHFFDPEINLMVASFLLPTFLAALSAIFAFFIGRRLMNEVAGFFAAMFITLSPMFISRTLGSDTDIWNTFFSLLSLWLLIEAIEAKSIRNKLIFSGLVGASLGAFAFSWGGWWYTLDFIVFAVIGHLCLTLAKNYWRHKSLKRIVNSEVRYDLIILGAILFFTAVFVTIFANFELFKGAVLGPISTFVSLKAPVKPDLWPNVFTTVAELNESNIPSIISQTAFGLKLLFSLSLLGIVFSLIKRKPDLMEYGLIGFSVLVFLYATTDKALGMNPYMYVLLISLPVLAGMVHYVFFQKGDVDLKPAILLTVWYLGMIIASIKGVRFILLLIPAFSVAVGIAIGYVYQYITRVIRDEIKINKLLVSAIVFLLLCTVLYIPLKQGYSAGENFTPSMTRGWWDSLQKINKEAAPDAIINSWWDFGHWFKYVADRRVTLDGVTQNHPNAHWLGLILQTSSEREALGILRMLDCGSNNAFEEVNKKYDDTEMSENVVSEIVMMSREDGRKYLEDLGFAKSEQDRILELTHCDPPEDYFITSEDMVGKSGVWAHFGLWDFDRAFIVNNVKSKSYDEAVSVLRARFNYTEQEASKMYYDVQTLNTDSEINSWVSPWPAYFAQWAGCQEKNASLNDKNVTVKTCTFNRVLNQDALGGMQVLQEVIYNPEDEQKTTMLVVYVDSAGNVRQPTQISPVGIVVFEEDEYRHINIQNGSFGFDVMIDLVGNRAMIADPLLSQSMFTKLFYLDGRYTENFEKFSDVTDVTGTRIIVWKVNWPNEQD